MSNSGIHLTRLTAPGRGAVAVLRVDVDDQSSAGVIDTHFSAANNMQASVAPVGRILYGHWGSEDVVVVRTEPQQWEVNCHGGEAAVNRISADIARGAAECAEGHAASFDESFETQLNAALLQQLLKCRTQQTAKYLLAQQQGVLMGFVQELKATESPDQAKLLVDRFLGWRQFAEHLTEPWKIAIVGQPNAGKSSLLNAIVGFERSIVFDQPGTTRDRVEAEFVLEGWPFRLIDTAGIREQSRDEIEAIGVDSALASLNECDACLLVVDATVGWSDADAAMLNRVAEIRPVAVLLNKSDLLTERQISVPTFGRVVKCISTSVETGNGLPELMAWLPQTLVPRQPDLQEPLPVLPELLRQLISQ